MKKTQLLTLGALVMGAASGFGATAWIIGTDDTPALRLAPEVFDIYGTTGTTTFVQEGNGPSNPLPGDPNSPAANREADDDFYFAGVYNTQVDGGAAYTPIGVVTTTEIAIERAVTNGDPDNRIHFNFDGGHTASDVFTFSFAMLDLNDNNTGTGQYDFSIAVNGVNVGSVTHTGATIGTRFTSDSFTLADVGATAGPGFDNYVELIADPAGSSARWANFDYMTLEYEAGGAIPEPSSLSLLALVAGFGLVRRRR